MMNLSQPVDLAVFNILLFILLLISLFFYHNIFPKKKLPLWLLLTIISILPVWSFWRIGMPQSGDFDLHTKLLMSFYNTLKSGVILPQWSAEFCGGFGWPQFKYFYKTHFYVASLFHFLGLSFMNSMKLLFSLVFVLSGTTMFLWLKDEFDDKYAFIGSIFYLFAPYQLINLHFKHTIGENFGFMLVPLVFLMINKVIKKVKLKWLFFLIISYSLLILSHHITPLLITPVILGYTLIKVIFAKNIETTHQKVLKTGLILFSLIIAIFLTAFHWFPIITESNLIQQSEVTSISFYPFSDLIFSEWKYGLLFQGPFGENSSLIGYTQLIMIIFGVFIFFKKKLIKYERYLLGFSLSTFFLSIIMMQSFTASWWQVIPLLNKFYFSTRFLFLVTFVNAITVTLVVKNWFLLFNIRGKKKEKKTNISLIIITIITIGYTVLNWGNRGTISDITDRIARAQIHGRCDKPTTPLWFSHDNSYLFQNRRGNLEILSGKATFIEEQFNPQLHRYNINAQSKILVKENTVYFPGWIINDNGKEIQVNYQTKKYPGLMVFELDEGEHILSLKFVGSNIENKSKQISIITLILITLSGSYLFIKKNI